ncbi:hypothetical protein N431DRAFT_502879 [Stipitochalara longipes BDJ]|nr:hypothetical protein N431DRAFT_502879 [Stipitochalara longipes BDJ]
MLLRSGKLILPANEHNPKNVFHLFKNLPPELRIMIWKMNVPKKRIVRIRDTKKLDPDEKFIIPAPFYLPAVELTVVYNIPAILHVNIESRTEGLKVYMSPFYARLKHPLLFDLSGDILVFDGHSPSIDFLSFFHFWFEGTSDSGPQRKNDWEIIRSGLRNLIIGNSQRSRYRTLTYHILAGFSKLKLLGSPSVTDYHMPGLTSRQVRYPPPGVTWRILQRNWARKSAGKEIAVSKDGIKEHWAALVQEDIFYIIDTLRDQSLCESLGIKNLADLMEETISKSRTPWLTPTDIHFFDDRGLHNFLLELETSE